ncbi:MAG: FtsX-like permease family protein [Turicibacter sp.]|nr:FtsX-like permease family protein [Turicibacter sp.]
MNFFNRALTSLKRQWTKSLILLVTVFVLGFLLTGATIVRNAILQTEHNLWSNMPRIATINLDFETMQEMQREAIGNEDLLDTSVTSQEVIREIGALPYVEHFNYTFNHLLWNGELEWFGNSLDFLDEPAFRRVQGVYHFHLLDIDQGIIQIVEGRTFSEEDMVGIGEVALVSQEFAEVNGLTIGSVLRLESRLYDDLDDVVNNRDWLNPERILESEAFELEVIGLFEVMIEITEENAYEEIVIDGSLIFTESFEALEVHRLQNQIYAPISVVEASPSFEFERVSQQEANGVEALFVLYDPLDMPSFIDEANELLSGWWRMADLSGNFGRITSSMETMQWVADLVFWGGTGASVIILILFMLLFLYDRKHEIGIYLALGEKRKEIVLQVLSEVLLLTVISLSFSIFVGRLVATQMSQQLLEQDVVRQVESGENKFWGINNLARHDPREMTVEEMMDHFEITFESTTVIMIFSIGTVTVLFATLISMLYVIRLNPKKILL